MKKNKILISVLLFIFSIITTFAVYNFYLEGTEPDGAGGLNDFFYLMNDTLVLYDNNSYEYLTEKKRFYLGTDTIFNSELYGDFRIKNGTELIAYKSSTKNSACIDNDVSYYFSGTLISNYWGELNIINTSNNYYCPSTNKLSIPLDSLVTGTMIVEFDPIAQVITIKDSYGNEKDVSISNVFDNKKLSINGSYIGGSESLTGELSNSLGNIKGVEIKGESDKLELIKNIDKNINTLISLCFLNSHENSYKYSDIAKKIQNTFKPRFFEVFCCFFRF